DSEGNPDWESVNALDVPHFNQDLKAMLAGETVQLPVFDFVTGKSTPGPKVQLETDQPVLIEGLHGLNDELTREIPVSCKYKIFVSALTQLNLTPYLRVPTSDVRLLRRLVRGYKFRGHSAEQTLEMWRLVRLGEEKYIFPFQETADVIFNSSIVYELNALRDLAAPLLEAVPEEHPCFPESERILHLLYAFEPIVWDQVPRNSILREFVGGSSFDY
ncbi:nucleoside kinase, partial [candidate division KSB1 bacterium]|nr:nucleoside kinase [candidate division KSB1 bacterium]